MVDIWVSKTRMTIEVLHAQHLAQGAYSSVVDVCWRSFGEVAGYDQSGFSFKKATTERGLVVPSRNAESSVGISIICMCLVGGA